MNKYVFALSCGVKEFYGGGWVLARPDGRVSRFLDGSFTKLESTSSIFDISSTSSLAGGVLSFPLSARGVGHVVPIREIYGEFVMSMGYVYILTNPSFREDWVKIGKSLGREAAAVTGWQ